MLNDHIVIADRLLHTADTETNPTVRAGLVAEAAVHAAVGAAVQAELGNLIAALTYADDFEHPLARLIILRNVRRRLGLFPALTTDGENVNGGQ